VPAVVPFIVCATRLNHVVELGAEEMHNLCVTCGALRDDGDHCAVAPFERRIAAGIVASLCRQCDATQ